MHHASGCVPRKNKPEIQRESSDRVSFDDFTRYLSRHLSKNTSCMRNFASGILLKTRGSQSDTFHVEASKVVPILERVLIFSNNYTMNSLLDTPRASLCNRCKYCKVLRLLRTFRRRTHRS